jgi:hypothetical protein
MAPRPEAITASRDRRAAKARFGQEQLPGSALWPGFRRPRSPTPTIYSNADPEPCFLKRRYF